MNHIREILEDIRSGKMVILVDDESRENEGDLILAADFVTPQTINFMAREARGLICLALTSEQIQRLGLPMMVQEDSNLSPNKTAFTVSIEASTGVSTGISAADRAHTIRVASSPASGPGDVIVPGHVFPIRARKGGVLKRAGHTEASVDLARLSGLNPAAVICEIMNEDGTMARMPDLREFALKHKIKIGTIEDLIEYRLQHETFVEEIQDAAFPTEYGSGFRMKLFRNQLDGREHLALYKGDLASSDVVPVRVHTENPLGDIFRSDLSNTRGLLELAIQKIDELGVGVVVFLRSEDMGLRLQKELEVYRSIESGAVDEAAYRSVFRTDQKEYGLGAQILRSLGLSRIILMSNNVQKRVGIKAYGLDIVDMIQLGAKPSSATPEVLRGLDA
jgi:3,4-dihydroxy 2-butanone 4-phosphate synthase / GTP cyclohydrolase II